LSSHRPRRAGDHYVLTADLLGVAQEDIKIELNDNVLTVAGERRSSITTEGDGYRRLERSSGRFSCSLTLPEGIDPESISASATTASCVEISGRRSASRTASRSRSAPADDRGRDGGRDRQLVVRRIQAGWPGMRGCDGALRAPRLSLA
jgi:hypothetical protein